MKFDSYGIQHVRTDSTHFFGAIPEPSSEPIAVVLLYFPTNYRKRRYNFLLKKLQAEEEHRSPLDINPGLARIIRQFTVDVFIYDHECNNHQLSQLSRVVHSLPSSSREFLGKEFLKCDKNIQKSYSRCASSNAAYAREHFISATTTPGALNICEYNLKPIFKF